MDNKGMELTSSTLTVDDSEISSRLQFTDHALGEKHGKSNYTTEDVYDPFSHRDKALKTSTTGALLHMLKSSLGTGILAMPNAFKNGGLIFGFIGTCLTGFVCTHCVYILVQCSQTLSARVRRPTLGFAETAEAAFKTGPPKYRFLSSAAREFVYAALFATYFFGTSVYLIFISRSFEQVIEGHFHLHWKVRVYSLILILAIVPLGIIRTLKYYVPFSALANIFIIFGIALTLYYTLSEMPEISSRKYLGEPTKLALFFATILYAMEGIGTVLPIENAMRHPQHFLGCVGVLNVAMTVVTTLFALVGFFGYLRFGDETEATVTLNLSDSALAETVKICVALSTMFTYGLQFTVPAEIMWQRVVSPKVSETKQEIGYYVMRGTLILGTVAVATALPSLSPVISLVGAICFSILGLFCPAIIEIMTLWEVGYGSLRWRLWKNILLVIVSIACLVTGSYASIQEIIEAINNNEL